MSNRTWVVLGAAVTIIGGGALLIAVALIVLLARPSAPEQVTTLASPTVDESATEEPTQPFIRTRAPAAAGDGAATPTPLPLSAGNSGGSSQSGGFVESPRQSVVNYYRDITARNYDASWEQLSDDFKQKFNCCAPNYDYDGYTGWWTTVQRVDFGEIELVEQDDNTAVVYAELIYTMEAGGSFDDEEPYIELVYSEEQGRWLFQDKRDAP